MSERKQMTFSERIENFWYYKKWYVVLFLVFIIAIMIIASLQSENAEKKQSDLRIISVFATPYTTQTYDIDKRLSDGINDVNGDGKVRANLTFYYIEKDSQKDVDRLSRSNLDKEFKYCTGDIMLFDKTNLEIYMKKDIFSPISDYLDISTVAKENIVYKNDVPIAVELENSKIFKDMGFSAKGIYASVMFLPENADAKTLAYRKNAKIAIKKLLEKTDSE